MICPSGENALVFIEAPISSVCSGDPSDAVHRRPTLSYSPDAIICPLGKKVTLSYEIGAIDSLYCLRDVHYII